MSDLCQSILPKTRLAAYPTIVVALCERLRIKCDQRPNLAGNAIQITIECPPNMRSSPAQRQRVAVSRFAAEEKVSKVGPTFTEPAVR